MDSGINDSKGVIPCNGSKPYAVGETKEEAESLLLPPAAANGGGIGKKQRRQRSSRRRVQWNDRNGNKLVEVLEYQPRFNLFPFWLLP